MNLQFSTLTESEKLDIYINGYSKLEKISIANLIIEKRYAKYNSNIDEDTIKDILKELSTIIKNLYKTPKILKKPNKKSH